MYNANRILVTSALPYANGPLHLGHLAGAYLPADIYVRFQRLYGKDVVFVCGSDEHGAAITLRAIKDSVTPQDIIDKYHGRFVDAFDKMNISFDIYHRTSAELHHETSQEFFRNLNDKGEFVIKEEEQYFDESQQQFLADRYIQGTCPKCSFEEAYGDQCEQCGSSLSPQELINPVSKLSGAKPILKKTKHWYLPLDKYEDWLREWITTGELDGEKLHYPEDWKKHVIGQCKSWLDGGLRPRSMTRDLSWGVDVPQELEGAEGKKLYVWMDAPIGYISATKQWAKDNNANWEDYWKKDDSALVHFIGKDNIVFHCLIFPAILKAHGDYILPVNVPANQFMNLEGKKISTSKNWAVWVNDYVERYPDKTDELRYYLIKNMPEQKDSEFTWKGYQAAVNNELVNNLANFINRVIVLTHKYYDGVVPEFNESLDFIGFNGIDDYAFFESELLSVFDDLDKCCSHIRQYEFRSALSELMNISAKGNQLLQFNEPWKLVKTDPEKVKVIMNLCIQIIAAIGQISSPFMPEFSQRLLKMLALDANTSTNAIEDMMNKLAEGEHLVPLNHQINKAEHLFTRIDDAVIEQELAILNGNSATAAAPAKKEEKSDVKGTIQYDDFVKMDIRVATIEHAEKVPKADRLLKINLDLGNEKRTVVSGIAEHFKAEEIVGKQVSYLANLAGRKIRGVQSEGMILLAEDNTGKLVFVSPEVAVGNGAMVK